MLFVRHIIKTFINKNENFSYHIISSKWSIKLIYHSNNIIKN